jgi:geranyl-CoA carboxylase beta subunit
MAKFNSELDSQSQTFKTSVELMNGAISEVHDIQRKVVVSAEKKAPRYIERGLLSPRQRLNLLLDAGAPFLELSALCGYMQEGDKDGSAAGGGCITGIGYIEGNRCMVVVDDYLTKGGSITELSMKKRTRMMEIALKNKLPLVTLAQSGGGNLKKMGDFFGSSGFVFATQARLSAAGVPQITVVHGSATAGGAYQPGLSDYVVMIRNQSTVYLAGPPLLKAATGEIATDEEIGGAEMHSETSGTADYLAENDADGVRMAREILKNLGWNEKQNLKAELNYSEPLYEASEMMGIVPADSKTPFDIRDVVVRVADASDFFEFKPDFDTGTVCGHMRIKGMQCGVIGNNSPITAHGAVKAAQFIQLCEQAGNPIVFLHNTTGFLVGTAMEQAGIIKHGSKLIQAVSNSTSPKISIVIGGSYGAGNYAMCGRGMTPDFMFSWPRSTVSVMGAIQAGSVMRQVAESKMKRSGNIDQEMLDDIENDVMDSITSKSNALANTARIWDDGIIDPKDTRNILAFVLSTSKESRERSVNKNTFGIGRL